MCGIYCCAHIGAQSSEENHSCLSQFSTECKALLERRGPNASSIHHDKASHFYAGCVLWQQGAKLYPQPVLLENNVLLLNGDLFMDDRIDPETSDTEWLAANLSRCKSSDAILGLLRTLIGPFSLIYFHHQTNSLYVARDRYGRNSLLLARKTVNNFIFSSVVARKNSAKNVYDSVCEFPPLGVLEIHSASMKLHPWQSLEMHEVYQDQFRTLTETVQRTITIGDCVLGPAQVVPMLLPSYSFESLMNDFSGNTNDPVTVFEYLLQDSEVSRGCRLAIDLLEQSLRHRIVKTPPSCRNCLDHPRCTHPRVGILFSGGIDCSILAALSSRIVEKDIPIDLLNVSFEKKRSNAVSEIQWDVPDRLTAKQTIIELRNLYPERVWNLVEMNVTRAELEKALSDCISTLVYPLENVLDESLGAALWFASRGQGAIAGEEYHCPCRVLLMGSGADELFGGYTRHRNAFKREKNTIENGAPQPSLFEELALDWVRLPSRNLARDDRVISDHGITVRAPFLDERFLQFVNKLEPIQKCYLQLPEGIGDKLFVRLCGYSLGLVQAAALRKRALQFGTRIADSRQNAKEKSCFLIGKSK